jgi:hypothetical protein
MRTMRGRVLLAAVATGALLIAACGDDDPATAVPESP